MENHLGQAGLERRAAGNPHHRRISKPILSTCFNATQGNDGQIFSRQKKGVDDLGHDFAAIVSLSP